MIVDVCLSPALYPSYQKEDDIVVVVDIFRASTTMCMAFSNGASALIPVADMDVARKYKLDGFLVGAERNTRKVDFADFGNSPFEYTKERVQEKEVVFTTTNGTRAIEAAKTCKTLLIGAFSNIDSLAKQCIQAGNRVVVLCAGWNNRVNMEDTLFAGALAQKLILENGATPGSDTVNMSIRLWKSAKADPISFIKESDHYQRLVANGVESDAAFCFEANTVKVVPQLDKTDGKLKIYPHGVNHPSRSNQSQNPR